MGHSKTSKIQKETENYLDHLYHAMGNILFQLIRLFAPYLAEITVKAIVDSTMKHIMEQLTYFVHERHKGQEQSATSSNSENQESSIDGEDDTEDPLPF